MYKFFCLVLVSMFIVGCSSPSEVVSPADIAAQSVTNTDENAAQVIKVAAADMTSNALMIYPSAQETQPLEVGSAVPSFNVQTVDGAQKSFSAGARDKPLMLVTFRGGWCPFCNVHLQELRKVVPELSAAGMEIVFLSGDRPEVLYAGLKGDAQATAKDSNYVIYSDANVEAASVLGIAFKTPEKMRGMLIDKVGATDSSVDLHSALPVPAVFIIDTKGEVAFVYTNPDYKVRLSAEDTKAAAMEVLASN